MERILYHDISLLFEDINGPFYVSDLIVSTSGAAQTYYRSQSLLYYLKIGFNVVVQR
jgi:hypothetical protein